MTIKKLEKKKIVSKNEIGGAECILTKSVKGKIFPDVTKNGASNRFSKIPNFNQILTKKAMFSAHHDGN